MSLNSLIPSDYGYKLDLLNALVEKANRSKSLSNTLETKILEETEALGLFEKLLKFNLELREVKPGSKLSWPEQLVVNNENTNLMTAVIIKAQFLMKTFLDHYSRTQDDLLKLEAIYNRIMQKQATLNQYSNSTVMYSFMEYLTDLSNLNLDNIKNAMQLDTIAGVAVLPKKTEKKLQISNLVINSGSNGVPGNSDVEVSVSIQNLNALLNEDPLDWFEYEKLDSGPLLLNLEIHFYQEEIVNMVHLDTISLMQSLPIVVEDIVFHTADSNVSIKELVSPNLVFSDWIVDSIKNNWRIYHMPIKCKKMTICLKQSSSYPIRTGRVGAYQTRNRWAIGLKGINVFSNTYVTEGALQSKALSVPDGLYLGNTFVDIYPKLPLYEYALKVNSEGNVSETRDKDTYLSFLLNGKSTEIDYSVSLSVNPLAFKNMSSFSENQYTENKSVSRIVRKGISPQSLSIPEKIFDKTLLLETKLLRRSSDHKKTSLAIAKGNEEKIFLPFSIFEKGLQPDGIHLYANNRELTYNTDNTSLASNEWSLSDDGMSIELPSLTNGVRIDIAVSPESLLFYATPTGYVAETAFVFDPDVNTISLETIPGEPSLSSLVIPKNKKVINLPHKNILSDTVVLSSLNGTTYTEVFNRSDLSLSNTYYVDYSNGVVWLSTVVDSDTVRVSYKHFAYSETQDYEILYDLNLVPYAVKVAPNRFKAVDYTDRIGDSLGKSINPDTGLYEVRNTISSTTKAKALTYSSVVKGTLVVSSDLLNTTAMPEEIEYIDGVSEFFNLIHVTDEKTTNIESTAGKVTFQLGSRSNFYDDLGIVFSDTTVFSNREALLSNVNTVGDYHIDSDGVVTVFTGIGVSLEEGISISYYYKNGNFDPSNKYSVDYRNGILYSYGDLNEDAIVSYKASNYRISYDICNVIKSKYNSTSNEISFSTEKLHRDSSTVKILWNSSNGKSSLIDLVEYFSPIISYISMRFY